jgi:aryl-alcohol dehydrogenase-like predicted oxidoreductase
VRSVGGIALLSVFSENSRQSLLAWLLAQGPEVVPIPGTKRRERPEENLGALQVRLSAQDATRISQTVPAGAAAGTRYPDMAGVYR